MFGEEYSKGEEYWMSLVTLGILL